MSQKTLNTKFKFYTVARSKAINLNDLEITTILDTNRVFLFRPITHLKKMGKITEFGPSKTLDYDWTFRDDKFLWNDLTHSQLIDRCSWGSWGNILWGREIWALTKNLDNLKPSEIKEKDRDLHSVRFKATQNKGQLTGKWRPSVQMPRWASRIYLIIKDIDVVNGKDGWSWRLRTERI